MGDKRLPTHAQKISGMRHWQKNYQVVKIAGLFRMMKTPTKLLEASWRLDVFENVKARAALESFEFFTRVKLHKVTAEYDVVDAPGQIAKVLQIIPTPRLWLRPQVSLLQHSTSTSLQVHVSPRDHCLALVA
jgi:hypothetical protein